MTAQDMINAVKEREEKIKSLKGKIEYCDKTIADNDMMPSWEVKEYNQVKQDAQLELIAAETDLEKFKVYALRQCRG